MALKWLLLILKYSIWPLTLTLINQMLKWAVSCSVTQNITPWKTTVPLCWCLKIPAVQLRDRETALMAYLLKMSHDRVAHPFSVCLLTHVHRPLMFLHYLYEHYRQCVTSAQPFPVCLSHTHTHTHLFRASHRYLFLSASLLSLQFNPLLSETAIQKISSSLNKCNKCCRCERFRLWMDVSQRLSW